VFRLNVLHLAGHTARLLQLIDLSAPLRRSKARNGAKAGTRRTKTSVPELKRDSLNESKDAMA
jgi:hypothetical protein